MTNPNTEWHARVSELQTGSGGETVAYAVEVVAAQKVIWRYKNIFWSESSYRDAIEVRNFVREKIDAGLWTKDQMTNEVGKENWGDPSLYKQHKQPQPLAAIIIAALEWDARVLVRDGIVRVSDHTVNYPGPTRASAVARFLTSFFCNNVDSPSIREWKNILMDEIKVLKEMHGEDWWSKEARTPF